jgi:hypothetical protein
VRPRNPAALSAAIQDQDARAEAIRQLRLRHDREYRKRYGMYLRGQMERPQVDGHETLAQWYERHTGQGLTRW